MVNLISRNSAGPIGLEIDSRAVQLMQFNAERTRLIDSVRWELPHGDGDGSFLARRRHLVEAIRQAMQGRKFRGQDVVACISARDLYVQNIRVPKGPTAELPELVRQEAATRLPFPVAEADVRFVCAGEVRQGDQTRREVVLLACHKPEIEALLHIVDEAGLHALAIDVEPASLLRAYRHQFRREDDMTKRVLFVRGGAFNTTVVIAHGYDVLLAKYINVGGTQLDEAVADHLKLSLEEAATLRRTHGDRRVDHQDPEIVASVNEATRPVLARMIDELSLCIRYHNVAFRGQPIDRIILGGSEARQSLANQLQARLGLTCQMGDPLRSFEQPLPALPAEWDVTVGLALRDTHSHARRK